MHLKEISDKEIGRWLNEAKTVVILGCSDRPERTSYQIARYLQKLGFRIIPVNPNIDHTLGEKSYDSVLNLPKDVDIDIIDIFRNKKYTDEMMEEIIKWSGQRGKKPLVWAQLGVSTDSARKRAAEHQLPYVENRCIMVEYRKLVSRE